MSENDEQKSVSGEPPAAPKVKPTPIKHRYSGVQQLGTAALAIVLYLLLLDAAVETLLSGSPVRWIVAGAAVGYITLSVLVWRRLSWGAKVAVSLLVLLGLLATTAWMPEGLTHGMNLLRQPTSTVLTVTSTFAIILSGYVLVWLKFVPIRARAVISFLAVYGLAAFVLGIAHGTPYPDLFHGHGMWERLPYWLQGTFVGALVLVPAALLLEIVAGSIRAPRFRAWGIRSLALIMSVVIAAAALTAPGSSLPAPTAQNPATTFAPGAGSSGSAAPPLVQSTAPATSQSSPSAGGPSNQKRERAVKRIEKAFQLVEARERELPRETFDPKAVIAKVGSDPTAIFHWVRDNTYWVPYRGALRGATGVLMDRLGNSLDRALLLSELLHLAGAEVRLAHANLTEQQSNEQRGRIRPVPKDLGGLPSRPAAAEFDKLVDRYARQYQLDIPDLRERIRKSHEERDRLVASLVRQAEGQAYAVAASVGITAGKQSAGLRPDGLQALRDHWWVQLRRGPSWVDLDPLLPGAEPGQVLATAPDQVVASSDLVAQFFHEISVRVIIERWEDGRLTEVPVLEHVLRPAELFGTGIALTHEPADWPKDFNPFGVKDPAESLQAAILAQKRWRPVLRIGSTNIMGSTFTDSGEVIEEGAGSSQVSGPAGLFGGAFSQAGANSQGSGSLTAEWIEYEIRSPGQELHKVRRELFDFVGAAARVAVMIPEPKLTEAQRMQMGLMLFGATEILPLVCQLSSEFVSDLIAGGLIANRDVLLDLVRQPQSPEVVAGKLGNLTPAPSSLYVLALIRQALSRRPGDVYLDRPNIFSDHTYFGRDRDGKLVTYRAVDIVANEVAVRPDSDENPSLVRLEQGVFDTNAEALLATSVGSSVNTAEIFAASREQKVEWLTVRAARNAPWSSTELTNDVRARLEQELASGYVVIVPKSLVRIGSERVVGWWHVDPNTGYTLGIGERGWGQAMFEYAQTHWHIGSQFISAVGLVLCAKHGVKRETLASAAAWTVWCFGKTLGFYGIGAAVFDSYLFAEALLELTGWLLDEGLDALAEA